MYLVSRNEETGKVSVRKKSEGCKGMKTIITAVLEFFLNLLGPKK